jgi:hypothetical protein
VLHIWHLKLCALGAGLLSLAIVQVAVAQTSGSDGTVSPNLSGPCQVMATIAENGTVIDPSASGGVYTAPVSGSASYNGSIGVPAEERAFNGKVWVKLPRPFPSVNIKTWEDDNGKRVSDSGTVTWDLPKVLPRGVIVTAEGFHQDTGARCSGAIKVKLAGGFLDSPAGPVAGVLTLLTFGGLALAATPKGGKP